MKPYIAIVALALFAACKPKDQVSTETTTIPDSTSVVEVKVPALDRLWETPATMTTAESVLFDADNNLLYVSCIGSVPPTAKDSDGFIAMVSLDGKIITQKWVTGLHAPKGMGLIGNTLFVTDIDKLVAIDKRTGKVIKSYPVEGAEFLNDVATTPEGLVYFTDSNTSTVYKLELDKVDIVKADTTLGGTNGICMMGGKICVSTFESGFVHRLDATTGAVETLADGIPSGDGIERYGDGFLVSNWNGEVYYLGDDGRVTKILDTKQANLNAADIKVVPERNVMYVPTFFGNTVTAYQLRMPL